MWVNKSVLKKSVGKDVWRWNRRISEQQIGLQSLLLCSIIYPQIYRLLRTLNLYWGLKFALSIELTHLVLKFMSATGFSNQIRCGFTTKNGKTLYSWYLAFNMNETINLIGFFGYRKAVICINQFIATLRSSLACCPLKPFLLVGMIINNMIMLNWFQ